MFNKLKAMLRINPYSRQFNVLLALDTVKSYTGIIIESLSVKLIGDGFVEGNLNKIFLGVTFSIIIAAIQFTGLYVITLSFDKMMGKITAFLRGNLMTKSYQMEGQQYNLDDAYYTLTNDTSVITKFYRSLFDSVGSVNRFIASIIVGLVISWQLCIIVLVLGVVKIAINKNLVAKMEETIRKTVELKSKILSNLLEVFEASPLFRFYRKSLAKGRFNALYSEYRTVYAKETRYTVGLTTLNSFLDLVAIVTILGVGSLLAFMGMTTLGSLVAFIGIQDTLTNPISFIGEFLRDFKYQTVSFDRYVARVEMESQPEEPLGDVPDSPQDRIDEIRIENVRFAYAKNGDVIRGLNAVISAGEITYIIGESGAGKTTLLKLLTGILRPDSGRIEYRGAGAILAKPRICYVAQTPLFLKGSVSDNITLSLSPDDRKVMEAIEKAQLSTVFADPAQIQRLMLDAKATNLSSGQKDRLAMARALYHEAQIMILDEVFSSLDNALIAKLMPAYARVHESSGQNHHNRVAQAGVDPARCQEDRHRRSYCLIRNSSIAGD